jgi:2'-5' RNA ligase
VRCFVCIEPDAKVRNSISLATSEMRQFGVPAKYVLPEQYHVNLEFLGDVSETGLAKVKERLAAIRIEPFFVRVTGAGSFPDESMPRTVYAMCESSPSLSTLGKGDNGRPYTPHITIARIREPVRGNLSGFVEKFKKVVFGEFLAREILLKESVLTRSRPIHRTVESFPLGKGR